MLIGLSNPEVGSLVRGNFSYVIFFPSFIQLNFMQVPVSIALKEPIDSKSKCTKTKTFVYTFLDNIVSAPQG